MIARMQPKTAVCRITSCKVPIAGGAPPVRRFVSSFQSRNVSCAGQCSSKSSRALNLVKISSVSAESEAIVSAKASALEAEDVIRKMYEAYNAKDVDKISEVIADDCSYHDLAVYQDPFVGKETIVAYFAKVMKVFPDGTTFVIDEITSGDPYKCGVMWHLELDGVDFPFTRGCSFYTVNSNGQIIQARDLVEGVYKPGAGALEGLKLIAPIIKTLKPGQGPKFSIESAGLWSFYAVYSGLVLFSSIPPGQSAFNTPSESLQTVLDISINFFYVNIGLAQLGVSPIPAPVTHPVYEGLFNIVCAWSMLFLPVILTDKKCQKMPNKVAWWTGIMFITNVFFVPFLALRAGPEPESMQSQQTDLPAVPWAPALALCGLGVGLFSTGWLLYGRPEFGDFSSRWDYFLTMFNSDRVFWAFTLDMLLYGVWQAEMLKEAEAQYRFLPFFGLVAYLVNGSPKAGASSQPAKIP